MIDVSCLTSGQLNETVSSYCSLLLCIVLWILTCQSNWWRTVKPKSSPHESAKCRLDISGCQRSKGESKTICFSFSSTRDNAASSELLAALNKWNGTIESVITLILAFNCECYVGMCRWWKLLVSISITRRLRARLVISSATIRSLAVNHRERLKNYLTLALCNVCTWSSAPNTCILIT